MLNFAVEYSAITGTTNDGYIAQEIFFPPFYFL